MCFQKIVLCPFHWRARTSGVSLESQVLENIPQVPENRAKVGQNHHARKVTLATPSGVSVESLGLENIPQVPGNQAEVRQDYHARKAVPATLSVLK